MLLLSTPAQSAPPFTSGHLLGKEHALARLTDKYEVKQIIGSGAFAKTRLCVEKGTCRHFAVKSIDKEALSRDERKRVRREMQCMYHLAGAVMLEGGRLSGGRTV